MKLPLFLAGLAFGFYAPLAEAITFTVTSTADPGNGVCTVASSGDGCTLREAITAANNFTGDDVITFTPGLSGTIQLTAALPTVSSNMTITGPGPTTLTVRRDTGGDYRLFTISNGTGTGPVVSISGLTLANGRASGANPANSGGALFNDQGTLTVSNCVLSGNSANTSTSGGVGGAIANLAGLGNSATLLVQDCIFSGNSANTANGNDGTGGGGGAIQSGSQNANVTVLRSIFAGNSATNDGGAIRNGEHFNRAGNLTMSQCTLLDNTGLRGGAISNLAGVLEVTNSTFHNNSTVLSGGAISAANAFSNYPTTTVTSSTFSGNSAPNGGGIDNFEGSLTIRNTLFQTGAAGVNIRSNSSPNAVVTSDGYNLSDDDGGGFLNRPTDQILTDPQLDPAGPQNNGGLTPTIALLPGSPAVDKGRNFAVAVDQRGFARPFDNPSVPPASGGDQSDIGAFEANNSQLGPTFTVNTGADHDDGGCTPSDCTLREAIATANLVTGADTIRFAPNITSVELSSALPNLSSDLAITGSGALIVRRSSANGIPNFRIFTVSNGTTTGPVVQMSGLTISNGRLDGISFPQNSGGGLFNDYGVVTLTDCTIAGNAANYGGGLSNVGRSALTLGNCTVNGNHGSFSGGGVYNVNTNSGQAALTIRNCTFSENSAETGGGISNYVALGSTSTVTVLNSTFSGNLATASGGGIRNQRDTGTASLLLANTLFQAGASGENLQNLGGAVITSQGHNLSSDAAGGPAGTGPGGFLNATADKRNTDPQLDPAGLQSNGGPTFTIALQSDSPAIDMGNDALAPTRDQRGYLRAGGSDIGAFEFNGVPPGVPLVSVISRKTHGASGDFDVNLPTTGNPGVECRSGGATNDYQVVYTFPGAVTFNSAAVTSGAGMVSSASGNGTTTVTVNLTGVSNAQRITVTLLGVNNGTSTGDVSVPMGVLVGDTNGNGTVNATDIGQTKAQSGQPVTAANFRTDVNANGTINATDIGIVKANSGSVLPMSGFSEREGDAIRLQPSSSD